MINCKVIMIINIVRYIKSHTEKIGIFISKGVSGGQDTAKKEEDRKSAVYVRKICWLIFKTYQELERLLSLKAIYSKAYKWQ